MKIPNTDYPLNITQNHVYRYRIGWKRESKKMCTAQRSGTKWNWKGQGTLYNSVARKEEQLKVM